ncbi:MAG TPA: mechanosensitive ion channel domain-containing protein [Usitatibacter sp.]|nr:mechanosensitive ion channel domain-containing protein [Usitatibacter sp.]
MSLDFSPALAFIDEIVHAATLADRLWQLGVAATALVLGWYAAHVACRQFQPSPKWKFGAGDFERVAYPLFAWVFMSIGRMILEPFQAVGLITLFQTLLVAWIVIRLAVYILGHVLPEGGVLRASVRTIAWIAWIGVLLHVTGVLPDVIAALDDVGITVGKNRQRVTLWLVMQALTALFLTLAIAAWISRITETRVMAAKNVEMSTRVVIAKLVRVATLFLAVLVALPLVGIDITALSIFSGALGVGLGFGLQKIASNYVSGFIVLLDRSLRIGDIIMVDNRRGEVTAIESRYTVIKGANGVESIIPNEKLITESVNHHTYTDAKVSLVVAVSIAYDSDVEAALGLLLECAARRPHVIPDPASTARVKELGDHGIALELTVWTLESGVEAEVRSALLLDILATFKRAGIEIPYPRRDVRLLATVATPDSPVGSSN